MPRRAVLDFGVADLSTQELTNLLQALTTATDQRLSVESESQANKQRALQHALGAAAMLNPTFHIYDAAIDTEEVGVDLRAEAKGSPLAPKDYTALGDVAVRAFDNPETERYDTLRRIPSGAPKNRR